MAGHPRDSSPSDTSSVRRNAPNFSRPQPKQSALKSGQKDYQNQRVHILDAHYDANRDFPTEARFSDESERTEVTSSENSASSDFAWDGQTGELDNTKRKKRYDDQRSAMREVPRRPGTAATTASGSTSATSERSFNFGFQEKPPSSLKPTGILKRVSVDQRSERIPSPNGQFEDNASHHTVSESGDSGSFDMEGNWTCADDVDMSGLTDEEVRKLRKKGINPALYAEMKAAKKGKSKWMPSLLGNGFIN